MADRLVFQVFSKGTVSIDRLQCVNCQSKACVRDCRSSKMRPVLVIKEGVPELDFTPDEVKKGACTECLSCELNCQVYGNEAITIDLPIGE